MSNDHDKEVDALHKKRSEEAQGGKEHQSEALKEITNLKQMLSKLQQTKDAFNATLVDQRVPQPEQMNENCDPILLVCRKYDIAIEQIDIERKAKAALTREKKMSKNWTDYSKPAKKQIEELEALAEDLREQLVQTKTRMAEAGQAPIEKAPVRGAVGGGGSGSGGPRRPAAPVRSQSSPRNKGGNVGGLGGGKAEQQQKKQDRVGMARATNGAAAKAMSYNSRR
jgi:hypothetical protein